MPDEHGRYTYFDTPDGCDPHKKAWYISKWMAKLAFFTGTMDAFVGSSAVTRFEVACVYGKHFGVLIGTGLAFVSATFIATDLTQKDRPDNHAFGASAAVCTLAAAMRSHKVLIAGNMFTPFIAYQNKWHLLHGVNAWSLQEDWKRRKPLQGTNYSANREMITRRPDEMFVKDNEAWWEEQRRKEGSEV